MLPNSLLNYNLLNENVQKFIQENLNTDISKILLKKKSFEGVSCTELVEQIESKNKCKNKLPKWFGTPNIYFPSKISVEQSSSELVALYKSRLTHGRLLDMTGGFGVDDYYFAQSCQRVIHCEIQPLLSDVVKHNFAVLKQKNVDFFCGNSFEYLSENQHFFDIIYVDPARRNSLKEKVFLLKDCEPSLPENLDFLWKYTNTIMVKTSPLLDIQQGIKELNHVSEVHIISVNNEVKELLFILKKEVTTDDILIKCINITACHTDDFSFFFSQKNNKIEKYNVPLTYLYEPNASIMKSGAFGVLCQKYKIDKLANHSHLFTSNTLVNDFQGRIFKIIKVEKFGKNLKNILENQAFNITTRNFVLSVAQIRKKFKIVEGSNQYIFFTTLHNQEKVAIFGEKIKKEDN